MSTCCRLPEEHFNDDLVEPWRGGQCMLSCVATPASRCRWRQQCWRIGITLNQIESSWKTGTVTKEIQILRMRWRNTYASVASSLELLRVSKHVKNAAFDTMIPIDTSVWSKQVHTQPAHKAVSSERIQNILRSWWDVKITTCMYDLRNAAMRMCRRLLSTWNRGKIQLAILHSDCAKSMAILNEWDTDMTIPQDSQGWTNNISVEYVLQDAAVDKNGVWNVFSHLAQHSQRRYKRVSVVFWEKFGKIQFKQMKWKKANEHADRSWCMMNENTIER